VGDRYHVPGHLGVEDPDSLVEVPDAVRNCAHGDIRRRPVEEHELPTGEAEVCERLGGVADDLVVLRRGSEEQPEEGPRGGGGEGGPGDVVAGHGFSCLEERPMKPTRVVDYPGFRN